MYFELLLKYLTKTPCLLITYVTRTYLEMEAAGFVCLFKFKMTVGLFGPPFFS